MKAVTTEQIRQLDARTIAAGTPGQVLMDRAGLAVARAAAGFLQKRDTRSALLLAGKGNNGGDAIVAARHLAAAGCQPTLILLCRRQDLKGDPLLHFQQLTAGIPIYEEPALAQLAEIVAETEPAIIVDGLLGTGLSGDVREPYATAIDFLNGQRRPVLAIDIPSGLDSDTGAVHGRCVRAELTVTMALPKIGLLRPEAGDYVGRLEVADIGFPRPFIDEIPADIEFLTAADVAPLFPPRARTAHKGGFGHLLVIAGSEGYTGAPVLAAHAAARAGAGLVTLAVPRAIYPIVAANCPPEIMPRPLDQFDSFAGFDAAALGPGMGQTAETQSFVRQFIRNTRVPTVVDADGLNALAKDVAVLKNAGAPLVLTPHPGEMGRLAGLSAQEIQTRRWEIARSFARQHQVVVALKGAGTVVTDPGGKLWINSTGNPGMARGGMGDALTGLIGAFLARGLSPLDAARAGVFLHGLAGDLARDQHGEQSMLVTDLILSLGAAFAAVASS